MTEIDVKKHQLAVREELAGLQGQLSVVNQQQAQLQQHGKE